MSSPLKKSGMARTFGLILILVAIAMVCLAQFAFRFDPKTVTFTYIDAMKKGNLAAMRSLGPNRRIFDLVTLLGMEYREKVKNAYSVYLRNGFEIWAISFEEVWEKGRQTLGSYPNPENYAAIAQAGFASLPEDKRKVFGNADLYVMQDEELPSASISRERIFAEMTRYVIDNRIGFAEALKGFAAEKIEFVKKMAESSSDEETKQILNRSDLAEIDSDAFIQREGERLLKEKLIEKYARFTPEDIHVIDLKKEFQKRPFRGNETMIRILEKESGKHLVFRLKRDGFFWRIVDIPGDVF